MSVNSVVVYLLLFRVFGGGGGGGGGGGVGQVMYGIWSQSTVLYTTLQNLDSGYFCTLLMVV